MSFNTQKSKLLNNNNKIDNNKGSSDKLSKITLLSNTSSFSKINREIILADHQLIEDTTYEPTYQFENLDDSLLDFLIPYTYLETTDGYTQYTNWTFFQYYYWEKFGTTTKLHWHIDGFLLTPVEGGGYTSSVAPVYITAKIKVINPSIIVEIKKENVSK